MQIGYPKLLERRSHKGHFNLTAAQKKQFESTIKELNESIAKEYRAWATEKISELSKVFASEDEQVGPLFKYIGESIPSTIEVFAAGLPTEHVLLF